MGESAYFRQLGDEFIRKSLLAGSSHQLHLLLARVMLPLRSYQAILDILEYRVVEEEWFLLNKSDLRPPPLEVNLMQIFPANGDCAISEEEGLQKSVSYSIIKVFTNSPSCYQSCSHPSHTTAPVNQQWYFFQSPKLRQ